MKLYKLFWLPNYFIICIFLLIFACRSAASEIETPSHTGNFALPSSQQPGALVGFGQNIINKNETQLAVFADDFAGVETRYIDVIPSVLYGITNNFSIYLNAPIAASYRNHQQHSAGFEDAFVQLEYAFYNYSSTTFQDQATIVGNVTFPTGSIYKNPQTGVGAPSFFIGTTFNRTYADWVFFASPGAILTTAKNGTKFGNSYLYQFGFGRNITNVNGWILAWFIEVDGTYSQRDRVRGVMQSSSGGNTIYVTPSIWASTKYLVLQFGPGVPISQDLFGKQTRETYSLMANIEWSIY